MTKEDQTLGTAATLLDLFTPMLNPIVALILEAFALLALLARERRKGNRHPR